MASYAEYTVANIAELNVQLRDFLAARGWTISDDTTIDGYNSFTVTKLASSHHLAVVDHGQFLHSEVSSTGYDNNYSFKQKASITYAGAVGLAAGDFPAGWFYIACQFVFPLRCLFFELSGDSLLLSFEIGVGKWRHVLSANVASPNGITAFMSGSYIPAGFPALYLSKDMTDLDITENLNSGNKYYGCQFLGEKIEHGRLSSYQDSMYAGGGSNITFKRNGTWMSYKNNTTTLGNVAGWNSLGSIKPPLISPDRISSHSAANIPYVYSLGKNHLTGMPVLFPLFYTNTTSAQLLFHLPDIFACSASVCTPGKKVSFGVQDYFTLPFGNHAPDNACMAVRCN